ncbi:hypothetical protein CR513_52221, partial [Mucuna pruriens]
MNGHNSHEEQALKVAQDEASTGRGRGRNVFQDIFRVNAQRSHKTVEQAKYVEGGEEAVLLMAQHSTDDKSNAQKMWFIDLGCNNHMTDQCHQLKFGTLAMGIQRQLTASYMPQQNGVAEEKSNHYKYGSECFDRKRSSKILLAQS